VKKITIIIFLFYALSIFGKVNDNLGIFTKEGIVQIDKRTNEIEKARNVKIYINSLPEGEGFSVSDPQKVIMVNISTEKKDVAVNLNISRDMPMNEYDDEIDFLLNNIKNLLEANNYDQYILEILDGLDEILEKIKIEIEREGLIGNEDSNGEIKMPTSEKNRSFNFSLDFKKVLLIAGIVGGIGFLGILIFAVAHRIFGENEYVIDHGLKKRKNSK
jgi:hypothetical protein